MYGRLLQKEKEDCTQEHVACDGHVAIPDTN
jgi:hypothetical protein